MELESKKFLLKYLRKRDGIKGNQNGISKEKPCYFNTGCCSYSDGDITGIEINDKKIKLIKWSPASLQSEIIETADLDNIFSLVY